MAIKRVANVVSRKCGQTFYPHGGLDIYHNSKRSNNQGWRFYIGNTLKAIRFNVEEGQSGSSAISSIDFWDDSPTGKHPVARLNTKGRNVVELIDGIVTILQDPKAAVGHTISPTRKVNESMLQEAVFTMDGVTYVSKNDAIGAALMKGYSASQIVAAGIVSNVSQVYPVAAKVKMGWKPRIVNGGGGESTIDEDGNEIPVEGGVQEISMDPDVVMGNKLLANKKFADPEEVFDDLDDLVRLVLSGTQSSLLVTGMPGIGKTYNITTLVKKILNSPPGESWQHFKGKTTPFALAQTLFEYHDQLIVFDDCDNALILKDCVDILKGALDSYDTREVSWLSRASFPSAGMSYEDMYSKYLEEDRQKLPRTFKFEGQIIFISNKDISQVDEAIRSRTLCIDITLKASDVILRIRSLLKDLAPDISMKDKEDALAVLERRAQDENATVDLRTMVMAAKIKSGGSPNADRLIAKYA